MGAFARVEFSMQADEFFDLTLGQWEMLMRCHRQSLRRRDEMLELMVGQLIAMVANTAFKGFKDPRDPKEFMPSRWGEAPISQPTKRLTKAQRAKIAQETREIMRRARIGK